MHDVVKMMGPTFGPECKAYAQRLRDEGETLKYIADRMGVCADTIWRHTTTPNAVKRPRINGGRRGQRVVIYLSDAAVKRLRALAASGESNVSEVIRSIITKHFEEAAR